MSAWCLTGPRGALAPLCAAALCCVLATVVQSAQLPQANKVRNTERPPHGATDYYLTWSEVEDLEEYYEAGFYEEERATSRDKHKQAERHHQPAAVILKTPMLEHDVEGRGPFSYPLVEVRAVITREVAGFEVSLAGDEGQPMHITRLDHSHGAAAEAGFTMQVSRHRGQVLAFSMKSATIAPKLDPITKQPQEQVLFRARLDKSAISRGVCIGSAVFAAPPPSHAVGDAPGLSDAQNRRHLSLSVWMPKARCAPAPHRRFHWAPLLAIAAVLPLAALCAHRWHAGDNAMRSIARKMA